MRLFPVSHLLARLPPLVALGGLMWGSFAWAGAVEASVVVPASPSVVMGFLADAARAIKLSPDVKSANVVSRESGGCVLVDVSTSGLSSALRYRTRRCPKADGYEEKMVESEDFSMNEARWTVTPSGEGSRVNFRVEAHPRMLVPEWMVEKAAQLSARAMVKRLAEALASGVGTSP